MNPPDQVRRDVPLARYSTVKTGGSAQFFARAGEEAQLIDLLRWAHESRLEVAVLGSGSNLLIADHGVPGLVIKLDGQLAQIEIDGLHMICGAGVRLPTLAAHAARAGLAGIEFAVNIPGTVGGAVRMNANAYGGQLAATLEWVDIATISSVTRRSPDELGFAYRSSNISSGQIVVRASFSLTRADPQTVKAKLAQMRDARHAAQPQGIKTFGSTFKNPTDPRTEGRTAGMLLSEAGCNGLSVGDARFAPKHANFIENMGHSSTTQILELMAEGRKRVLEHFGVALEPEVQTLGPVSFPWQ